jgi:ribosomal protein S18 acetylase RimI-like enzyme
MRIREYDPSCDHAAVRDCFAQLQDFERALDTRLPRGADVADSYLQLLHERCREHEGVVLVAEEDAAVVGFVAVLTRYSSDEPDDDPAAFAYLTDLVVEPAHRRRGLGRKLLEAAEARARAAGVDCLRLSVKAGNAGAQALYVECGFEGYELVLEKRLTDENA